MFPQHEHGEMVEIFGFYQCICYHPDNNGVQPDVGVKIRT